MSLKNGYALIASEPWSWRTPCPAHFSVFLTPNTSDLINHLTALPKLKWTCPLINVCALVHY